MALWKYELVVLIDSSVSKENVEKIKKDVDWLVDKLWWKVLDIDDIWYLDVVYEIGSSSNPYFYSVYLELDWAVINDFKRQLSLFNWVVRYKIFKMKPNQRFLKLKDIEKEIESIDFAWLTKSWIFNEINHWISVSNDKK